MVCLEEQQIVPIRPDNTRRAIIVLQPPPNNPKCLSRALCEYSVERRRKHFIALGGLYIGAALERISMQLLVNHVCLQEHGFSDNIQSSLGNGNLPTG